MNNSKIFREPINSLKESNIIKKFTKSYNITSPDNTNDNTETISDTNSNTMSDKFKYLKTNYKSILLFLFLFILAIIGFNVFRYLADTTDKINQILHPFISIFNEITGKTVNSTIDNTIDGTDKIIKLSSDTGKNIIDSTEKGSLSSLYSLQNTINNIQTNTKTNNNEDDHDVDDDEDDDIIDQQNGGYCYIGKSGSTRYCAKIDTNNKCMSGDIYPTLDKCINPKLK